MRIFLDTADIDEIPQAARLGVISGVTTNPSLASASIRHPLHCVEAARAGGRMVTIPFKVLTQMVEHP